MENKQKAIKEAYGEHWERLKQFINEDGKILSNFEIGQQYSNYVTKWHLNNAKEFVADNAKVDYVRVVSEDLEIVDKQSINTAIDNYIEINLNK